MNKLLVLTAMLAVMCVATSFGTTVLISSSQPEAENQQIVDFFKNSFADVTVIYGNYSDTGNAAVQTAIANADVFVIARRNASSGYTTADQAFYNTVDTAIVSLTSYTTRNTNMNWEAGAISGKSMTGTESIVTDAGTSVFGVAAGAYDWWTGDGAFWSAGTGAVGTGTVLATIGGGNLVVGWKAGDTLASGTTVANNQLLFNNPEVNATTGIIPDTAAGQKALLDAVKAYTRLGVSPYAATSPDPEKGATIDLATISSLSWQDGASDPNMVSKYYDLIFGTDPNMENLVVNTKYENVAAPFNLTGNGVYLDYETSYYWRVDTHITWDSNEITGNLYDTVAGEDWFFETLPQDKVPVVTAGSDVLTSKEFLPAALTGAVDDFGEGDIASVAWDVVEAVVPAAAKQMIVRNSAADLAILAQVTSDPNLLMDWIGTDTREAGGDPLFLTLKGLPAGTYSWTSYHHDVPAITGMFDVTVMDASGKAVTPDIKISDGASLAAATFTTSITSNGTDDVILVFDLHPYTVQYNEAWFVMNGFELTGTGDPLYIDFTNTDGGVMSGYQAYVATHEVAATFTEQSYSAFGATVSILPVWGGAATVVDTTNDPASATQSATLTTDWPTTYIVQLSATDSIGQTGSDTMTVTVAADACAAAQKRTSWAGFNPFDSDHNCVVNLDDFATFAGQWLDDRNLTGQTQF